MPRALTLRFNVKDDGTVKLKTIKKRLKETGVQLDTTTRSAKNHGAALSGLSRSIIALGTVYVSTQLIQTVISQADAYKLVSGRLSLVTDSTEELIDVQNKLFAIAQDTRGAYQETADLYARLARSTGELEVEQQSLLDVTDAINKSIIVSGSSAESANAAIMQLGQGFASGTLRGEELNSVLEQTPRLAQAIAEGMGVTIGQLRAMGAEGQLTSEAVFSAILDQKEVIEKEFGQMPTTIGQSFTVLNNEIFKFIGEADKATGASSSLAASITDTANAVGRLSKAFNDFYSRRAEQDKAREGFSLSDELEKASAIATELIAKAAIAEKGGFGAGNFKAISAEAQKAQDQVNKLADAYIKLMGAPEAPTKEEKPGKGPQLEIGKEGQTALDKYNESLLKQQLNAEAVLASMAEQNQMIQNNVGGIEYLNEAKRLGVDIESELGIKLIEQMALRDQLAEGEVEKINSIAESYLALRESMFSEEALWARFAGEAMIIEEAFNQKMVSEIERKTLLEQLEATHQSKITALQNKGMTDRQKFEQKGMKDKTKSVLGEMTSLTAGVANSNKALFNINKAAALANAGIAMYEGISLTMSKYPYPLNIALSALHGAAAMAQISSIASSSFGGGGSASAPSAGGGVSADHTIAPTAIPGPETTATAKEVTISLPEGDFISTETVRDLIEAIQEESSDMGINISVAS